MPTTLTSPQQAALWLKARVQGALHADSRPVSAGDGFIAWPGAATDGRAHVAAALARGAVACLVERAGIEAFVDGADGFGVAPDDERLPALLTLSDVLGTGHHAALAAGVGPGSTVAVIGDGAVGLCGVLAARRLGAERIVLLGRHEDRIAVARTFGATDVVPERGEDAVTRVLELTDGGFRELARRCAALGPPLVAVLEGGYNLRTLPGLVRAAADGFAEATA